MNLNRNRGLYFAPNAGGTADSDIVRFNAVFCEKDDLSLEQQHEMFDSAPVLPSIRVESRRSVHAYWLVKGNCGAHDWASLQQQLIVCFKSDPKIKNPSRVMRLPHFDHLSQDGNGHLTQQCVRLVHFDPERRYTIDEIKQAFPPVLQVSSNHHWESEAGFATWNDLNAELRRRFLAHPTCKVDRNGEWAHGKGICHNGKGNTALALNIVSGSYFCQAGCDTVTILKAFGLPEAPNRVQASAHYEKANGHQPIEQLVSVRCVAEIEAEPVIWLWHPYIPQGKVTLIEGDPGVGKSWMVLALATAVAVGHDSPIQIRPIPEMS
jgi:hypothetical protein